MTYLPYRRILNNLCKYSSFLHPFLFAAAAAKSLQLCLTLWDPIDCSLPGSSIHGIFQARVLEWVAIAFSAFYLGNALNLVTAFQRIQLRSEKYTSEEICHANATLTKSWRLIFSVILSWVWCTLSYDVTRILHYLILSKNP